MEPLKRIVAQKGPICRCHACFMKCIGLMDVVQVTCGTWIWLIKGHGGRTARHVDLSCVIFVHSSMRHMVKGCAYSMTQGRDVYSWRRVIGFVLWVQGSGDETSTFPREGAI